MAGDIHDRDAGFVLACLQVVGDLVPALLARTLDPRLQIESLLEVDLGDVVAPNRPVQLQ
jgi:hypothetical protein